MGSPAACPMSTRFRAVTSDGQETTVHVAVYPAGTPVRLVRLDPPTPVLEYAQAHGLADVISGGFFAKPDDVPLGELVTAEGDGHRPFTAPWNRTRGCLRLGAGRAEIGPRDRVTPGGELLQAGPLLVAGGRRVVEDADPEGFSSTREEFDQDLTAERLPRMAIALTAGGEWLAVAVDGRGPRRRRSAPERARRAARRARRARRAQPRRRLLQRARGGRRHAQHPA